MSRRWSWPRWLCRWLRVTYDWRRLGYPHPAYGWADNDADRRRLWRLHVRHVMFERFMDAVVNVAVVVGAIALLVVLSWL